MDVRGWDERYRSAESSNSPPTPLLVETARGLPPGRALDLACGMGRNALWLAERGWNVTAVDGSAFAIEKLVERGLDARVADLEKDEFKIAESVWDLIAVCYYLQRGLFEPIKQGLVPGGIAIVIVHLAESGHQNSQFSLKPGELAGYFKGWEILHSYEGKPNDPDHHRWVAEIVVRRAGALPPRIDPEAPRR